MSRSSWIQRYLLPGLIFQSVVIGGGYGTGRELAHFFLEHGPWGGLLAMLGISTVIWSLVCAVTFEFARIFQAYDYRAFFRKLLGRGWILFEVLYLITLLLVVAVASSAAGSILRDVFGLPYLAGVLGLLAAVGILVSLGSRAIERAFAFWSLALYAVYACLFASSLWSFGDQILGAFQAFSPQGGWPIGGIEYAAYNLGVIPAVLFSVRHATTSREAVAAGLLAGPIAIFPALLFYLAMAGHYPAVLNETLPANYLLEQLGWPLFQISFQVILLGTLIETGTGFVHAVNERVAGLYRDSGSPMMGWLRPAFAVLLLLAGAGLAQLGLVGLVSRGYGTITWGFVMIYVIPVLTVGGWKIWRAIGHDFEDQDLPDASPDRREVDYQWMKNESGKVCAIWLREEKAGRNADIIQQLIYKEFGAEKGVALVGQLASAKLIRNTADDRGGWYLLFDSPVDPPE